MGDPFRIVSKINVAKRVSFLNYFGTCSKKRCVLRRCQKSRLRNAFSLTETRFEAFYIGNVAKRVGKKMRFASFPEHEDCETRYVQIKRRETRFIHAKTMRNAFLDFETRFAVRFLKIFNPWVCQRNGDDSVCFGEKNLILRKT